MTWTVQNILKNKICFDHQPFIDNKRIMKPGKMLKIEKLPEIDFGPIVNVKAQKEYKVEIFGGDDELNKILTRKIFFNFIPVEQRKFPECGEDCRPPMNSLMFSKKFANGIIQCLLLGEKLDTGIKVKAAMAAYTCEIMDQPYFKNHTKMSNPKSNFQVNDRCSLLRLKIRFKIFYTKLDLYRMKIEGIIDPNCSYCITLNVEPEKESLSHLLMECKNLRIVWKHFRKEINSKWRARYSFLEMLNGPCVNNQGKLKSEYVFLRIINRLTGIRNGEGMETDPKEKLIKTCDDAIRVIEKVFDKKLKVSLVVARLLFG